MKSTKMPSHVPGAAQKMRQLSPHQPMPSAAGSLRGGGAVDVAASADGTVVDSGSCMTLFSLDSRLPSCAGAATATNILMPPASIGWSQLWRSAR